MTPLRGFIQATLFLVIAAWSSSVMAQCTCPLPSDQTCPPACGTCVVQPSSCTCQTPCTALDATCSAGYTEISQSDSGCSLFFYSAVCRRTGTMMTSQCATCAPGRWGSSCTACPGGASTPCNGHGTCSQGLTGDGSCTCDAGYAGSSCQYSNAITCNGHGTASPFGTCTCDAGFSGAACDACDTNYYGYPNCVFCDAATTCNGQGVCDASGACACSPPYAGAGCDACAIDYYNYPQCTFCQGQTTCRGHGQCDATGACVCDAGYGGASCVECGGVDADGDGVGSCDCNDADPTAWATPGEVGNLDLTSPVGSTKIAWSAPLQPGGNPILYETLRFDDPRDFNGPTFCFPPSSVKSVKDTEIPALDHGFFYLVRAKSNCPAGTGPLGFDSSGNPLTGTCQ